jgi:eukaryotic-like serine/threonine-protein kinase
MDEGRWERIEELFETALQLTPAERDRLLAEACGGDDDLRLEIEAMIDAATSDRALALERLAPAETAAAPLDPMVGALVGSWRVVGLLGRGGMGTVYSAERADGHYQQRAALKLVSPGAWGPSTAARFRAERQVLARLSHPNIARLLDGGLAADGRPYLVMELVEGAPITSHCAAHALSVEQRLRLFRVVCDAVQHAHGALVVHRDLKPSNTLVSSAAEVKLLDFGIAKLLEPDELGVDAPLTRDTAGLFTPEYAAPEQFLGGAITTATDVYSLGVLLYELLTGVRPFQFEGKRPAETERAITSGAFPPPSRRLGRRRGDDLDAIVFTALQPRPERRYASAGQLGEDIGRFLEGRPVVARPDTLTYRIHRFVGRHRVAVGAAALLAVSLVAFGVVAGWQARRAAAARDAAELEREKAEKVVGLLVELFETTNPNVRPDGDKMSIREFLANAGPRVLERLQSQPAVRARMRHVFGRIFAARFQLADAGAALEQALAEQRQLLGPDHPDSIESLYQLAIVRQAAGDEIRARVLLEESLERCHRVVGENHEKTARTLAALASLQGALEDKRALLERALAIRRRVLPQGHPEIAENLGQLANYYSVRRDNDRARALFNEALAMFPSAEARRDPRAIMILNDFSVLLMRSNERAQAESVLRESLELARAVFGADSLPAAYALNNLAVQLATWGRHPEAEQVFRASYERHLTLLGEEHWMTVNVARNVGWILALEGRYGEALDWMDRATAAVARTTGTDVRRMRLHIAGRRGVIVHRLGRSAEGLAAIEAALAELPGSGLPDQAALATELRIWGAAVLIESGRAADGEVLARAALAEARSTVAEQPMHAAQAECMLGWALATSGRDDEGRRLLRSCLPAYRAWGLADPKIVASLDALVGGGALDVATTRP